MKSFTPLFIIAICVWVYFAYIGPTYATIQTVTTEKDNYNKVLEQAKNVSSKRDQVLASYNAVSSDNLSRLGKIVPSNFNSVTFVNHLNTIASKYGIVIDKMQIVGQNSSGGQVVASDANSYQTKSVSFSVKSQYTTFMNFLKDLESGLYLVDVTGLSIKKSQQDKTGQSFEFNITVNTYSLQ